VAVVGRQSLPLHGPDADISNYCRCAKASECTICMRANRDVVWSTIPKQPGVHSSLYTKMNATNSPVTTASKGCRGVALLKQGRRRREERLMYPPGGGGSMLREESKLNGRRDGEGSCELP